MSTTVFVELLKFRRLNFDHIQAIINVLSVFIDAKIGFPLISGLVGLLMIVLGLGLFVFTIIAAIKGFQGQIYKIPVIGGFAEKYV